MFGRVLQSLWTGDSLLSTNILAVVGKVECMTLMKVDVEAHECHAPDDAQASFCFADLPVSSESMRIEGASAQGFETGLTTPPMSMWRCVAVAYSFCGLRLMAIRGSSRTNSVCTRLGGRPRRLTGPIRQGIPSYWAVDRKR